MTDQTTESLDATDQAILAILQTEGRLRTTHARITACLEHFAGVPEITSAMRLTGEDCFLLDVHARDARRLEAVVDAVARFGPVTTSLVLRTYEAKAITPAQER